MKDRIFSLSAGVNEFALCAILFFIPISKAILESLLGVALLGFLIKKYLRPDFGFIRKDFNFFLGLFMLFMALSLINSGQYLEKSIVALFLKWGKYILLYFMFQDAFGERKKVKIAILVFFASAALVSLDCLFQLSFGFDFFRGKQLIDMGNGIYAAGISFNNYNDLAAYLIISISFFVSLTLQNEKKGKSALLWVVILCSVFSLIFTFSRGGWLGFFAAAIFMLALSNRFRRAFFLIAAIVLLIFLIPVARQRFMLIFTPGGDANRFETWEAAFSMIKRAPFLGMGLGTFMDYFPKEKTWLIVGYAHNCFLQIWAESGVFSLMSFCLFLFFFFKNAVISYLKNKDFLVLGLASGLAGFVAHSFLDTHFYSLQLSYLFWGLAGLLASIAKPNKEKP